MQIYLRYGQWNRYSYIPVKNKIKRIQTKLKNQTNEKLSKHNTRPTTSGLPSSDSNCKLFNSKLLIKSSALKSELDTECIK